MKPDRSSPEPGRRPRGPRGPQDALQSRAAGLELVRRANRWLVAGAVGATALISFAAAQAFHGRTLSSAASSGTSPSGSSSSGATASPGAVDSSGSAATGAAGASQGLQAPAAAPAPTTGGAGVVSGGS